MDDVPPARWRLLPRTTSPWGPLASLALTAVAVVTSQVAGGVAATVCADVPLADMQDPVRLLANGTVLAFIATVATPVALVVVALAVWLRNGPRLGAYLALRRPAPRAVALGIALTLGLGIVEHVGSLWFGEPIPAFVAESYRTAANPIFLALAFAICAPLSEEVVFRGFLLTGLAAAYRARTAVLVTAAIFAALHVGQYGPWELGSLAVFGALLAVARLRSGSLFVPIAMHAAMNLVALLGTAAYLHGTR